MSHLYAIKFSNGAIKVGRSTTPKARIATHAERVACVGITVAETVIAECVGDPVDSEALLIENCKKYMQSFHPSESATITGTEWFSHLLDWPSVLLWVEQIAAAKIRIERLKRLTLEDVIGEDDEPPMSRFIREAGEAWAKRLIRFMRETGRVSLLRRCCRSG